MLVTQSQKNEEFQDRIDEMNELRVPNQQALRNKYLTNPDALYKQVLYQMEEGKQFADERTSKTKRKAEDYVDDALEQGAIDGYNSFKKFYMEQLFRD